MAITYCSNGIKNREYVINYLRQKKLESPGYKVLDVGGAASPWCDDLVDAYIDIMPVCNKRVFIGNFYEDSVWYEVGKEHWDFVISTHTLEDIRAPDILINKFKAVAKEGFISVPNKHTEFINIESSQYLGYCHHRWIFQITSDMKFRAIAKMPIVNCFNPQNIYQSTILRLKNIMRLLKNKQPHKLPQSISWLDKELASESCELAFIWKSDFEFEYINGDFAGSCADELYSLYVSELKDGL